jgi:hypothetical protein
MEPTNNGAKISKAEIKEPAISVHKFDEVVLPIARESFHEKFVTYGLDNLYPNHLINAWEGSSTHMALTNGIVQMISGESVSFDVDIAEVLEWINNVNRNGESIEDLIEKTAFDLYLHGYFGWQVVWNTARTKIVSIYHTPAEQIRAEKADDEGVVNNYFVSWDWTQYRKKKFEPKRIPAFNPTDRSNGKQMLFIKQYRPSQFYYSTPSYIGGLNWVLLDNRVGEFHLNNIENGFFPSSIVQFFNGEPPQDEKRILEANFMNKFTGKGQTKIAFVYNDNPEQKVAFDTHEPANIDKRFRDLMPEISKNIMIAHRVPSPLLFGIRDAGGLGNNAEELESSALLMNKMVIIPFQQMILQALEKIFKINDWKTGITIETLQPSQWLEGKSSDADASTEDVEQEAQFTTQGKKGVEVIPTDLIKPIIKHLKEKGESRDDLEKDGWVLIQDENEMTKEGLKLRLRPVGFSQISSDPEDPSYLDAGLYKIRYEYRGPKDEKNRDFCGAVLDLNLIYRKEDIDTMTSNGANPEFGFYSIWDYKGSYGCRHRWHRLIFFRKRNTKGQFMPNDGLENDKNVGPGETPPAVIPEDHNATTINKNL